VLCGDSGAGKSSLFSRFGGHPFRSGGVATVGFDIQMCKIKVPNPNRSGGEPVTVAISLWDTGGQERYRAVARTYLKDADACILVYPLQHRPPSNRMSVVDESLPSTTSESPGKHPGRPSSAAILKQLGLQFWVQLAQECHTGKTGPEWLLLGNKADLGYQQMVYDSAAAFRDTFSPGCDHEMISAKESDDARFQQVLRNLATRIMRKSPSRVTGGILLSSTSAKKAQQGKGCGCN